MLASPAQKPALNAASEVVKGFPAMGPLSPACHGRRGLLVGMTHSGGYDTAGACGAPVIGGGGGGSEDCSGSAPAPAA